MLALPQDLSLSLVFQITSESRVNSWYDNIIGMFFKLVVNFFLTKDTDEIVSDAEMPNQTLDHIATHGCMVVDCAYGCGLCRQPGVQHIRGNWTSLVLNMFRWETEWQRSPNQWGDIAETEGQAILGIKVSSAILGLPKFDLINGMFPDYMHCVLLGVWDRWTLYGLILRAMHSYNTLVHKTR